MDLGFGDIAVRVAAPVLPTGVLVVPVGGPPGPKGDSGDSTETLSFVQSQSTPVTSLQIHHSLPFNPAGVVCLETDGSPPLIGVGVSYPSVGIIELIFGAPFSGSVFLS
jgi:hypothetical protein